MLLTRDQVLHAVEALAMCGRKADKCRRLQNLLDDIAGSHRSVLGDDSRALIQRLREARTDLRHKVDATDSFFAAPARAAAQKAEHVARQNPAIAVVVAALAGFGIEEMVASSGVLIGYAGAFTAAVVPASDQVSAHVICCDRPGGVFTAGSASGPGAVLDEVLSVAFDRATS